MRHVRDTSEKKLLPVLLLTAAAGCSFALPVPQANYRPTEAPRCVTSRSKPAGDLAILAANLLVFTTAAACASNRLDYDEDPWLDECNGVTLMMASTGTLATVALIAAVRGFSKTSTCRKQWRQHKKCRAEGGGACEVQRAVPKVAPPEPTPDQSPECQAHKQAIRLATDPQARLRLIRNTPSRCLQ